MERRHFVGALTATALALGASQSAKAATASSSYVNVMDYGATGNGSTDDSPAFKSAVAALETAGGGTLFIPVGNYLINSTVVIAHSNIRIQGTGVESWIINGQPGAAAIQFGDGTNIYYSCGAFDLAFGQASGVSAGNGNRGLSMLKMGQSWIERCVCVNYPSALYDGFYFSGCTQLMFSGNEATGCLGSGFYWSNLCVDMYIVNMRSDACGTGFKIEDSAGFYVTNAAGYSNGAAWSLVTAGGDGNTNLWFTNCLGDTSATVNWNITNCRVAFFDNCWGSTQQSAQANTWASGFYLNGANVKDITFTGGTALYNNAHGVSIDGGAARILFSGFLFGDSTNGNGRSASGGNGLFIGTASDIRVVGSLFSGNNGYGLANGGGANVDISQSTFLGNLLGTLHSTTSSPGTCCYRDNRGFNPLAGNVVTPSLPASGSAVTNGTSVDCTAYLSGGQVTNVAINGTSTGLSGSALTVFIPAGGSVAVTYSTAPSWRWMGH